MVGRFYLISAIVLGGVAILAVIWPPAAWLYLVLVPLFLMGVHDTFQTHHTIRRNFPLLGRMRYLLELISPELHQYFIEGEMDGRPLSREMRSVVYQRAKGVRDTMPFGTLRDVYEPGYEWINHSLAAHFLTEKDPRVQIGGAECKQSYSASVLNISAMSYGALSKNAVLALNTGAKLGGFYHNTGEGGVSPYHLEPGGDLAWQIGTGYFGCRTQDGNFDLATFKERAAHPRIKLIEIKLSQGAKPGHGGILPAAKCTEEIAKIRLVSPHQDVLSPAGHSAFDSPTGLCEFIAQLREASGGKPVGFKLCMGSPWEFLAICKAMIETGILPDFITVDGGEGGTGAAPPEHSDSVGIPLNEGLFVVHSALTGFGLRDKVRVICSGKVLYGFDLAKRLSMGADLCNAARAFMLTIGCIQARRCNSNACPTGVTTQNPGLVRGLVVSEKAKRVASYHKNTVHSLMELVGAAGLNHPDQLRPRDIFRRVSANQIESYEDLYPYLEPGALLTEPYPDGYWKRWMQRATLEPFATACLADR